MVAECKVSAGLEAVRRLFRYDVDRSSCCVASEQCSLGPLYNFNSLNVVELNERTAGPGQIDTILKESDARLSTNCNNVATYASNIRLSAQ